MARHESVEQERARLDLDRLLAALEEGRIDALEDLTRHEVALLLSRARPGESLQDLFDRVRQPQGGRE